jgi:aldose 1-epimerase
MSIVGRTFGVLSTGEEAQLFTLKAGDLCLTLTNYGATLVSLFVPGKNKKNEDILLGYSTLGPYTRKGVYLGATIGRFGNRIGGAQFSLGGKTHNLYDNDNGNTLHGGRRGFDRQLWKAQGWEDGEGVYVRFTLDSPDGDEGYPGNLKATVCYGITRANTLVADYQATADAETPVNLTNHAYFNLAGEGSGAILSHEVKLYAASYLEVNAALIPTGQLIPVKGTPFDFNSRKTITKDIAAAGGGYDHCFIVDGEAGKLRPAAEVYEKTSGRTMRVSTTQPGIQFYTGNFLDGVPGKSGSVYGKQTGFCLETQHLPDAPNQKAFGSAIFGPARPYHEKAVFEFGCQS